MIEVIILTEKGRIIRFPFDSMPLFSRGASGVRALRLIKGDKPVAMQIITVKNKKK